MAGVLTVLLAASDPELTALLEHHLGEIECVVVRRLPIGGLLLEAITAVDPDAVVLAGRFGSTRLDELSQAAAGDERPIIMFVDRDDRALMKEAIAAGVSSYHVVGGAFPDIEPIVMAAVTMFRRQRQVVAELREARTQLSERDTITRAKSLLMKEQNLTEPQAYRRLRRQAMNQSKRITEIAAALIAERSRHPK